MKNIKIFGIDLNVILLSVVSLLNDISSEIMLPILPMFIKELGASELIVGFIGGLRDSIGSVLRVVSGYLSDKTGKRKFFVFSGYLSSAVFKFFLAFSKTWPALLIFSSAERIGKGLRDAPRDALIATYTPQKRGKAFGFNRMMDRSGAIIGSLTVFILFWVWALDFKYIILISAVIALISILPLFFVQESQEKPLEEEFKGSFASLPKSLKLFIFLAGIFSLANFSYMFFVLKAQMIFKGRMLVAAPIFLYILFTLFNAIFAIPLGILYDKIGRKKVIFSGYFLFSLTCLGFVFFNSFLAFMILFPIYGIVHAMIEGNQSAYVSDHSSESMRATALGFFQTTIGFGMFVASLMAGFLWNKISPNIAFIYASSMSFVCVFLFLMLRKKFES
jgi:MFS family permease